VDKKKVAEKIITGLVFLVPFGMAAIGGYYGYKLYKKKKDEKEVKSLTENKKHEDKH